MISLFFKNDIDYNFKDGDRLETNLSSHHIITLDSEESIDSSILEMIEYRNENSITDEIFVTVDNIVLVTY